MKIWIAILLATVTIHANAMSMKRGKATVHKSAPPASSAAKPPAPPASAPKATEDRGIRDMGCNDRDRQDPSKPCKNGGSAGAPTPSPAPKPVAAPVVPVIPVPVIPVVVATPAPPPPALPSPPPRLPAAGVPGSCARFHPGLGSERPLGPHDGAENEYRRIRDQSLGLNDDELILVLLKDGIGTCKLHSARPHCPQCFCDYYFQTRAGTWFGSGGWPINPASRASTGCVSEIQWGGYLPTMATRDLMKNAAEQARHALCHPADPCRLHPKNLGVPIHNSDVLGQ